MPATRAAAAFSSAPRRTFAQNSLRASTRNTIAATWKARPITSPMSSIDRLVAGDEVDDVPADRRDHVADQDPPGDALAGGQRRRQQGQHERPREAGVGEVEDVVVDELARHLDEPTDARRDAGDQRQGGDDADGPAGRRGHPPVPSTPDGSSEGHRPRGYSLNRRNGCDCAVTRPGPVYFSPGPWPGSSGAALDSRNANCSVLSPSRTGPACGPRYSADAVTNPASAVISRRASSRSRCGLSSGILRRQPELLGRGAHQHHRRPGDHLDGGNLGQLADGRAVQIACVRNHRSCLLDWHARPSRRTPGTASGVPLPPLTIPVQRSGHRHPMPVLVGYWALL